MTDAELAVQVCWIVEKADMPPGDGEDAFGKAMRRVLLWQRGKIERLRRENKMLSLKARVHDRLPFCPDHRDKVVGLPCRECEIERLQGKLRRTRDYLKFAANSPGGIVAEIDDVLKTAEAKGGDDS